MSLIFIVNFSTICDRCEHTRFGNFYQVMDSCNTLLCFRNTMSRWKSGLLLHYAYSLYPNLDSSKVICSYLHRFLYAFEWMEVPHSNHLVLSSSTVLCPKSCKRVNEFEQSVDTNVDLALSRKHWLVEIHDSFSSSIFLEGDSDHRDQKKSWYNWFGVTPTKSFESWFSGLCLDDVSSLRHIHLHVVVF
jgi:hypothetical protein